MTILDTIADYARERVAHDKSLVSLDEIAAQVQVLVDAELARDGEFSFPFEKALQVRGLSFICEIKKASPSKGIIVEDFPYIQIAQEYKEAGAAAISCLTEPKWFLGSDEYAREIARIVSLPVLRKDFVVDEYMIYQAKVIGVSAILLICSILNDKQLENYILLARKLGLSVLVEAHNADEVKRALESGAMIIGVNNRDLNDFSIDFENAQKLRDLVPDDVLYVVESGVKTAEDVATVAQLGADAVLIGEALMCSENRIALLDSFREAATQAGSTA